MSSCALLNSGGLKCWGNNSDGQLGNGTTTTSTTPVNVIGLSSAALVVTGSQYHTCAIVTP